MIFRPNFNIAKTEYSIPIYDHYNFGQLFILCLICLLYGMSAGINLSNFSVFLLGYDLSISEVSKILSYEFFGKISIAPFTLILLRGLDLKKLLIISIILRAVFLLIFTLGDIEYLWITGIIGFGVFGFLLYSVIFLVVNYIAPENFRATYLSLASLTFGIGLVLGPLISTIAFLNNSKNFFVISIILSLLMIPLILYLKEEEYNITHSSYSINLSKLLKFAYVPIMAALVSEFVFFAMFNFLPIYIKDISHNSFESYFSTSAFSFGSIILSFPFAKLLDKYNRINIIMLFTLIAAILIQLLPFITSQIILVFFVIAFIGGCTTAILIGSLAILGDKFSGDDFVVANSLVHGISIIGGYSGIKSTGEIIQKVSDKGLIYSISSVFLMFLVILFFSSIKISKK